MNTDSQTLLCWANMARNSLQMWNGFSSHQLIFGKNPNLPGFMTDGLPALEGSTSSERLAQHLNAMHATRRAYIETESNERIRRALRGKIRAAEDIYEQGGTVYYKREGRERWLGPATVVFQDGKVVFVRHGGIFVRVSPNRLRRTHEALGSSSIHKNDEKERNDKIVNQETEESPVSEVVPAPEEGVEIEGDDREIKRRPTVANRDLLMIQAETHGEGTNSDRSRRAPFQVKPNDIIRYKLDHEWITGSVLGRAGKASGKYKTWYNIRNENGEERSIDLERHEWEKMHETEINITEIANKQKSESEEIVSAKVNELEKLVQFDTYEEVNYNGQKVLSTRWVITNKNGQTKARLVVRGFEEKDLEIPRDSPTIGKGAMRLLISIAVLKNWSLKTTDIKSAFLQGKELEREIYISHQKKVRHHSI